MHPFTEYHGYDIMGRTESIEDAPMTEDDLPAELMTILNQCYTQILGILEPFRQTVEASPIPETIFHYTDDNGLRSILESKNLWLTDIFGLNDPSELRHGAEMSFNAIKSYGEKGGPIETFASSYKEILHQGLEKVANFFVCSFSKDGDDLGQWRAYADDGCGYALAFDTKILEQAFAKTSQAGKWGCSAFPVTYDDKKLLQLQTQMIEVVLPHIHNLGKLRLSADVGYSFVKGLIIRLALGCTNASIFFKHPAYEHEREYRFLQLHRADDGLEGIKFRTHPYKLIRYMEYEWGRSIPDALKEIRIGPAANKTTAEQFASACLKAYAFVPEKISIKQSNIPYRGR